ncbi:MAG: methyltransferase domain-containing protein [Sneathiellaceae bacterium]
MEMITAGTILGPDVLPYNDAHKAVWRCQAQGDWNGLATALEEVARHAADPLVLAIAAMSLKEFGLSAAAQRLAADCAARAGDGTRTAAVAAAIARGEEPFSALPGVDRVGDRRVSVGAMVLTIIRSTDYDTMMDAMERLVLRLKPPVDALPEPGYAAATLILNLFYPPQRVNIGGGGRFMYPLWANVDLVALPGAGPRRRFDTATVLPFDSGSIELVYSSHCLEHLDDPTVARLLQEMHRVLHPSGRLVLKLPDGEAAIRHWRAGNRGYFDDPIWALDSVAWSWGPKGVPDNLDSRFSMLFCGYWNEAMTHGGNVQDLVRRGAYHGPPRVAPERLKEFARRDSPHDIAQGLRAQALHEDPAAIFNHQNAWSGAELAALLEANGFSPRNSEPQDIIARQTAIPDIAKYRSISIYAEAVPRQVADGAFVTPQAAAQRSAMISQPNAEAWVPATLPDLGPRNLRRGFVALHKLLWEYHGSMVQHMRGGQVPSAFLSFGYAKGQVPPELLDGMAAIFDNRPFLLEAGDCRADGLDSELRPQVLEDLRQNLRFFAPDPRQRENLEAFFLSISARVETELQTPWRVLNVRCYDTSLSFQGGPQVWHRDGMPSPILKLLVYLTPDEGPALGSELIDLEGRRVALAGESGIWLLFDPNRLVHRGPGEGSERRRIVEVTLCGDLSTDTRYRFGGTNYRHPICPPSVDPFQSGLVQQTVPLLLALNTAATGLTTGPQADTPKK